MGMAASQARLLSITTRLTNNEFRSQMVANSKVRLANETQAASDEYMEALNATKLQYVYYDAEGAQTLYDLTASTILQYQPLKNQYALVNRAGQTMVNHNDATTFQQANNLDEFLELNDCIKFEEWEEENPAYKEWEASEPKETDPIYWEPGVTETSSELYDSFLWCTAICYGSAMSYLVNSLGIEGETLYDKDGNIILKYDGNGYTTYVDDKSGSIIQNGSGGTGSKSCYSHVLDHLLQIGNYTTSTGQSLSITSGDHWWQNDDSRGWDLNDRWERSQELSELFTENAAEILYACGDTGEDITPTSSDIEKLMSDYYFDVNGNKQLKTLQQKMVDLDYACRSGVLSNQELYDALKHFVEDDLTVLKKTEDVFLKDKFNADHDYWKNNPPDEFLTFKEKEILDPDKAEWYTNLWYRMNGAVFDEEYMQSPNDEDYNNTDDFHKKYFDKVSEEQQSWVEFDETLINSPEWLKFALESGEITLEKVVFNEDYDTTTELENKTWQATSWSSTVDIVEVTDELAITKAEVKYNQALRDIQAKDKEYDNDIKKLDTEHNALQTEYDSIKSVLDKNMERSFKAFS